MTWFFGPSQGHHPSVAPATVPRGRGTPSASRCTARLTLFIKGTISWSRLEIVEKPMENHHGNLWKPMKKHGKPMKHHENLWKTMDNHHGNNSYFNCHVKPFSIQQIVNAYIANWKMAIEIMDLPIENGDFAYLCYPVVLKSPSLLSKSTVNRPCSKSKL